MGLLQTLTGEGARHRRTLCTAEAREKNVRRGRLFIINACVVAVLAAAPADRFVLVQSHLNIRDTFRLDRWTGATHLLTGSDDTALAWTPIKFLDRAPEADTAPRYRLSLSRVASKGTYLVDTATGRTWVLLGTTADTMAWKAIP